MKPLCSILLCLVALPAFSATTRKLSVDEPRSLLTSLQQAKKTDADTAQQLKQIELTEELTSSTMNGMADLVPGPLTTEQMYVLEARSSMLAPPPSDIPTAAAPDAAAQQAMLAKAQDYVTRTYSQLPPLTASRMTARFQDGVENPPNYSSVQSGITDNRDPIFEQTMLAVRLMNTKTDTVEIQNGVEKLAKDKTAWGSNGVVASVGPAMPLRTAIDQILSSGSPRWLRWESINGHQVAVYSFAIDKKKAHYAVTYCCFPATDTTGTTHVASPIGAAPGAAPGNMQNSVEWNTFKGNAGYHGELFVDPATGTVLRLILQAQFKPSDFVHYEDIRTDFAPVTVGSQTLIVPIRTFTVAEIVPNGDANSAHFTLRHQMVTEDFKDYQPVGAITQK